MTPELKETIQSLLKNERVLLDIIQAEDFYFQHAKEALEEFLVFNVDDQLKSYLLENRKNYDQLRERLSYVEKYQPFGTLLFQLVSYCDSKALRKSELNRYPDKRVLAQAFVRMNNWVDQLIGFKFGETLPEGSIGNAIAYLQDPQSNFTMLSENHRRQLSENLFKKPYQKQDFKDQFIAFFKELEISVGNQDNYTHLVARLAYFLATEWKESLTGLLTADGTGWQDDVLGSADKTNFVALWNHRRPTGTEKTLKLLREQIEENGYFKIFYSQSFTANYVAEIVDFVVDQKQLDAVKWGEKYSNITWYNDKFSDYTDDSKSARIVYLARKIYKIKPIHSDQFKYFNGAGYPGVGHQSPIVSYQSTESESNQNMDNSTIDLLKYKKQIILQGPPGTGKTKLAKEIALNLLGLESTDELVNNPQFKLLQFHPSVTYEDFVRGIVAETVNDALSYKNVNKLLGSFAKDALINFQDSGKSKTDFKRQLSFKDKFEAFKDEVMAKIAEEKFYSIPSTTAQIFDMDDDQFRYSFTKNPEYIHSLPFHDFYKLNELKSEFKTSTDITNIEHLLVRKSVATYYFHIYKAILSIEDKVDNDQVEIPERKNFVLLIDEINRANLSSVLGELIYALEYRGEPVDSIYRVDGSNELILPPNLYIIGTMNTADRSVGHIDYAIRRRFGFVNVLPERLEDTDQIWFNQEGFERVQLLFNKANVSNEFNVEDVKLGHSYFIAKKEDAESEEQRDKVFALKVEYEVIPILLEYVKDGVLIGELNGRNVKNYILELKNAE